MIHILNGEALLPAWRSAGLPGTHFCFPEMLLEGPVAADLWAPAVRRSRAHFLQRRFGIAPETALNRVEELEQTLIDAGRDDEVVLWFEADLFCQVHLCWLLGELAAVTTAVSVIYTQRPGAAADKSAAQRFFARRRRTSASERRAARELWCAWSGDDPLRLLPWREAETPPFAARLVQTHLERFPSETSGLSLLEAQTLAALQRGGPTDAATLFDRVRRVPAAARVGLGDLQFFTCIADLAAGPTPLVEVSGDRLPRVDGGGSDPRRSQVRLRAAGGQVLAGQRDRLRDGAPDVWLGGVPFGSGWRRRGQGTTLELRQP